MNKHELNKYRKTVGVCIGIGLLIVGLRSCIGL